MLAVGSTSEPSELHVGSSSSQVVPTLRRTPRQLSNNLRSNGHALGMLTQIHLCTDACPRAKSFINLIL